ncbi:hypothetical protein DAI22_12g089000 [Oryza sativa Japonica Group]|nr:pinoresinol reductase 1 [Oryza sativa Japonica Group]KAF2907327.1 hypothetical protein DAI22_12g089000 [Oryza sativa Japonica Group]
MAMEKSRVLIVGGSGYIGRRIVAASLAEGHPTFVLLRPEIGLNIDKLQILLAFKAQGARLLEASLDDHDGLVAAVRQVDVVVSAMSGVHHRSHNILLQLKLVKAIKEAGNVKTYWMDADVVTAFELSRAIDDGVLQPLPFGSLTCCSFYVRLPVPRTRRQHCATSSFCARLTPPSAE